MFDKFFQRFSKDIGIDLGTANTLVYVKGKGIVINEPSVVAINQRTKQILAIGSEAKRMVGRTPQHIVATRPLVDGVISDFEITEAMLRYFIDKVHSQTFAFLRRPRVVIGIPSGVTEVERRAVVDAAINAGASRAYLIEEPMAAAMGSRLPVQDPTGSMIVDIGGGTTEIALISLGGIVISKSLRVAGDEMNENIVQFARENFNLLIGERTAEESKIQVGSAYPLEEPLFTQIRGRDLLSGLPKEITVSDSEIRQALMPSLKIIVNAVKAIVEEIPPELTSDVMKKGIVFAGGGSLLRGIDKLVSEATAMPVEVSEDPLTCVVRGTGVVVEDLEDLKDVLVPLDFGKIPR
ncbi:MAG: rod shape-determining protein [Candidatus Doudnabacteria bacterium]|nr:rod shape-determining protein [Candidatus Doudnabacteria bacterium]